VAAGWRRLALVDVATADVTLVDGRFDDFGTTPVWNRDGSWIIFDAPFDKSLVACDVGSGTPRLHPILRRRGRPGPLVDVTHLIN